MLKVALQSIRRPVSWMVVACLAILVFALAACGDGGSTTGSSSTGSSSNAAASSNTSSSAPVATVNIKEKKSPSGDVYRCDPTTLNIKKGDTVAFTNQSDEKQDFDQGDTQQAGVDVVMELNQSTSAKFNNPGTFTLKSEKGATITVVVS